MTTNNNTSRILGLAFLLQFITSVSSGLFIRPLWLVPDDISATMLKIAENPVVLRINILVDMLTALGVILLGAVLFVTLTAIFDVHLPFIFFLPYFPFELVIGAWILVKGVPEVRKPSSVSVALN